MKRVWIGAAVGLAVAVAVMVNTQRAVYADPAIVIKNDGLCGMPGAGGPLAVTAHRPAGDCCRYHMVVSQRSDAGR